jgi:hypothetical protein
MPVLLSTSSWNNPDNSTMISILVRGLNPCPAGRREARRCWRTWADLRLVLNAPRRGRRTVATGEAQAKPVGKCRFPKPPRQALGPRGGRRKYPSAPYGALPPPHSGRGVATARVTAGSARLRRTPPVATYAGPAGAENAPPDLPGSPHPALTQPPGDAS